MAWKPDLPQGGPAYVRIVAAMERDIADGVLEDGARLPPERDLAYDLGLSVGAVTRAYAEADRRGLLTAHVGRGTFVKGAAKAAGPLSFIIGAPAGVIDLARNWPPAGPAAERLHGALTQMQRANDTEAFLGYPPPGGLARHRQVFARWLGEGRSGDVIDADRLVVTTGAQQAMTLAFGAVCRPGDAVLCESATFQGMKALAEHAGYRLSGVAMDGEGLDPDALDRAFTLTGAKAVYILPTVQNPTTRTMGAARREEVAAVCARHEAWIVEDDVYAAYGDPGLPRLMDVAPARTLFVGGASKSLAPGLRVGLLALPAADLVERVIRAVRANNYAPPSFGAAVAAQWIQDGTAAQITQGLRDELRWRNALARSILGDVLAPSSSDCSLHLWAPMSELDAERTAGRALRAGVEVTPPSATAAPGCPVEGLRLCMGSPADRGSLEKALRVTQAALTAEASDRALSVV